MIKRNANANEIEITSDVEPGIHILVNGLVVDKNETLVPNVLIYFYQTSDKGWYSDTGVHILKYEGDYRHARLFGYVKT